MPNNRKTVVSRALFMGVGVFVVVSLWGWIGSGNIELLRLLLNAIVGIVLAVAFVVVDKIFLKEAEKA